MDRTKVSYTLDPGSIPGGGTKSDTAFIFRKLYPIFLENIIKTDRDSENSESLSVFI